MLDYEGHVLVLRFQMYTLSLCFPKGTRYMVVDCGGGTVDITVHEVEDDEGTLKELHKATGGTCGSVHIDQEFEKLLVEMFGQPFIDDFKVKMTPPPKM